MEDFKKRYNDLIKRQKAAEAYLDDSKRTTEEVKKWIPEYNNVVNELSLMIKDYRKLTQSQMTEEEIVYGFLK